MKKIIPLFVALLVLGLQTTFAGGTSDKTTKSQFQFTTVDLTQNSWDYAYLKFNVNDLSTGETLPIPSFLINYEVKDKAGNLVSKGSGLYMNVMDAKLGSEEDYTIVISTVVNGQKVSQSICKKASPKKFAMKIDASGANIESGALASNDINYSVTRPKFSNRTENENIQISPSDVSVNIALNNNTYKIELGANHPNVKDQAGYQALREDLKKMTADGKNADMIVEPKLVFKGDVYTDNQSYYEVTAQGITEVASLEAVASK
jgi:hypothetical protein